MRLRGADLDVNLTALELVSMPVERAERFREPLEATGMYSSNVTEHDRASSPREGIVTLLNTTGYCECQENCSIRTAKESGVQEHTISSFME